jgi:peroxiredoxin
MLRIGDVIEDLILYRPDGQPVRLSELSAGPLVLVFLRHLT